MHGKNSTVLRSTDANSANAETVVAKNGLTVIELTRDYPGLGFKSGTEIGLSPVNVMAFDPTWPIAIRVGDQVLIGHPYTIDEQRFALAQPMVFNLADVEILGELAAA